MSVTVFFVLFNSVAKKVFEVLKWVVLSGQSIHFYHSAQWRSRFGVSSIVAPRYQYKDRVHCWEPPATKGFCICDGGARGTAQKLRRRHRQRHRHRRSMYRPSSISNRRLLGCDSRSVHPILLLSRCPGTTYLQDLYDWESFNSPYPCQTSSQYSAQWGNTSIWKYTGIKARKFPRLTTSILIFFHRNYRIDQ